MCKIEIEPWETRCLQCPLMEEKRKKMEEQADFITGILIAAFPCDFNRIVKAACRASGITCPYAKVKK